MVVTTLIILWIFILLILALLLGRTPKGRSWRKILWHSKKFRTTCIASTAIILSICGFIFFHEPPQSQKIDDQSIFREFGLKCIRHLETSGTVLVDSSFSSENPKLELLYAIPGIIQVYNNIVNKPTPPRLVQISDTLIISFDGYKQFKNRGIRILKKLKKKLGDRYETTIKSIGSSHQLYVTYVGEPWDSEQLCSLPAMEAAISVGIDPAILMSLVKHTSDFSFSYKGSHNHHGLLALDSGNGLEQLFIGARMLRKAMDAFKNEEEAIASLYILRDPNAKDDSWRKSPFKNTWVKEILNDVQFYRNNGMIHGHTPDAELDSSDVNVELENSDSTDGDDVSAESLDESTTESTSDESKAGSDADSVAEATSGT